MRKAQRAPIYTDEFRPLLLRGKALPERAALRTHRRREDEEVHESVLVPRRISGHEGIGQLFEYRVEAVRSAPNRRFYYDEDFEIDLDAIRGTVVTLIIRLDRYCDESSGWVRSTPTGKREISGIVASAGILGTEGDTIVYEFIVRPRWWLATLGNNSRVFVAESITQILSVVLSRYDNGLEFRLGHDPAPRRDLIRQAWETDWNFCMRLCEEFGYVIWFEHLDGRQVLVIADHPRAYRKHDRPYKTLCYHPQGGHIGQECISHLSLTSVLTVDQVTVHDHSYMSPRLNENSAPYREHWVDARDWTNECDTRFATYEPAEYAQPDTSPFVRQNDHSWRDDAQRLARVKLEAKRCEQLRVKGRGRLAGMQAARTFTLTDHPHDAANREYLVLACTLDIRSQVLSLDLRSECSVEATFELQPADETHRLPQVTPRPRIDGYEYAVIVGPRDSEISIDAYNRLLIQYAWDREGTYTGGNSIWVRLALPWQGDRMGIVFHGRYGQQVLIGYINGDPDRPVVIAFVPDVQNMPPWKLPRNEALTGMVSRGLEGGEKSNHLALDDTKDRLQAQLWSDQANSGISLGSITRISGNEGLQDPRGTGAEVRTDGHVALRGARGVYVTSEAGPGTQGTILDMDESVQRLAQAQRQHEELSRLARQRKAQTPDANQNDASRAIGAQNTAIRGGQKSWGNPAPEMSRPDVLVSSGAGLATTAADSTHMASVNDYAVTAGRDFSVSVGRSYHAVAMGSVSLFAYRQAMRFIAANGPVEIQAQGDQMTLYAQKQIHIVSTNEAVLIDALKKLLFTAGGAAISIENGNIELTLPGNFTVHAGSFSFVGPASVNLPLPVMPQDDPAANSMLSH